MAKSVSTRRQKDISRLLRERKQLYPAKLKASQPQAFRAKIRKPS